MQLPFGRSTPGQRHHVQVRHRFRRTQVGPLTIDQRHHGAAKDAQTAGPDFCGIQPSFVDPAIDRPLAYLQQLRNIFDPQERLIHHTPLETVAVEWSGSTTAPAPATGRGTNLQRSPGPPYSIPINHVHFPRGGRQRRSQGWRLRCRKVRGGGQSDLERRSIERIAQAKRPMAAAHVVRSHSRFRPERPHSQQCCEDNATRAPPELSPHGDRRRTGMQGRRIPGGQEERRRDHWLSLRHPDRPRITLRNRTDI